MSNNTSTLITLPLTRPHQLLQITPSNLPGPRVGTCEGPRPTAVYAPNFNGPRVGTCEGPRPTAVYPPNFNGPRVGTCEGPRQTAVYPPNFNGPRVGTCEGPRPTAVYAPNFNGPRVGTCEGPRPTAVYAPNFNGPRVGTCEGPRPTAVYPPNFNGPRVGTCEGPRPTAVYPPNFNGPRVGTCEGPRPTAVYPPNFNGPRVGTCEGPRPTAVYPPNFNGPQVGTFEGPKPTAVYPPNFNVAPPVQNPGGAVAPPVQYPVDAEYVPEPGQNGNELSDELLSFIDSSMARVEANSMPPVYNQPPLPTPTPSTSTQHVNALLFTKKTVTETEECVLSDAEIARILRNFEAEAEYVPEPGQNGNELSDELLSIIDSSMARVEANSMPPVYNQPPLPTPTPSTSTQHVNALLFTKKTVTETEECAIADAEIARLLRNFEAEAAKKALQMEEMLVDLANDDMMLNNSDDTIPWHDSDIDVFDTLVGLTEEYVPEPGQNGNELSDELLSIIDSSMARVEANSMPPVYNQPPLPTPTPSTSTQHVNALLFTKKTVTETEECVIADAEIARLLRNFEAEAGACE